MPVYNAASFVEKAVESALMQPEVLEVLLIEDGSADGSLKVCIELAGKYEKVKLFTHPGHVNKGAGISRNVGIQNAKADYIAFLDADDFFLPDRFRAEREIFKNKPETDGVYGALGFHYYTSDGKKKFSERGLSNLTTLPGKVPPNELFLSLLRLHNKVHGHFSIDTLTMKRNVFFDRAEIFNTLKLHEDTVFILQLSLNCILQPGILDEPVGMRGVHNDNRIVNDHQDSYSRMRMWKYLYNWSREKNKDKETIKIFEAFFVTERIRHSNRVRSFFIFFKHIISNDIFLKKTKFFNPSCKKVFGNKFSKYIINLKNHIQFEFSKKGKIVTFFNSYVHKTAST